MLKLADVYSHTEVDRVALEESVYRSVLWQSGAIEIDGDLQKLVGVNTGVLFESRYWKDILGPEDEDPLLGGATYPDDSDNLVPTGQLTSGIFQAHKNEPVKAFAEADIIRLQNFLDDPLGVISSRLSVWWGKFYDLYAVAQLSGVLASNVLNNAGDMVHDISDATVPADPTNSIGPDALIDAMATAGDTMDDFAVLICHSKVAAQLRKQNLIDTIPSSDGLTQFQFYQNLRLLVSDGVPIDTSGANPVATSYILGAGVIGFGQSNDGIVPSELWRDPRTALGAGQTTLISRSQFSMHPWGMNWEHATVDGSTSVAGAPIYPSIANQRDVTNWTRVASDRKQLRMAFLITNV